MRSRVQYPVLQNKSLLLISLCHFLFFLSMLSCVWMCIILFILLQVFEFLGYRWMVSESLKSLNHSYNIYLILSLVFIYLFSPFLKTILCFLACLLNFIVSWRLWMLVVYLTKRQPTEWEKMSENYTSDRGWIFRMYKGSQKPNINKTNDLN
jgi:hypothetical protein